MPPKPASETRLTRVEIRSVIKKHRGSLVGLARELGITPQTVSLWLKGKMTSQRIADAAQQKALDLLEGREENAA